MRKDGNIEERRIETVEEKMEEEAPNSLTLRIMSSDWSESGEQLQRPQLLERRREETNIDGGRERKLGLPLGQLPRQNLTVISKIN